MNDEWRRWHPTPWIRWVVPDVTTTERPKLQQAWQHEETGVEVWRDVPTVALRLSDSAPEEQI